MPFDTNSEYKRSGAAENANTGSAVAKPITEQERGAYILARYGKGGRERALFIGKTRAEQDAEIRKVRETRSAVPPADPPNSRRSRESVMSSEKQTGSPPPEADAASVNPNLDAALAYAARGWHIYPCFPGTKAKTNLKWRTASTTNVTQITRWWTKSPNATICLDCEKSGLAVLDLDQKDGKDGRAALDWHEVMYGQLPQTLMQRTASGGTHLIFKGPIKTTVGANDKDGAIKVGLGEGIDTRGKGGMIVLAPTKLPSGQYEWLNDLAPAALPQWVADLAGTVAERDQVPDAEFTPTYTQEEFAERLNLIPVERYDNNHDLWLELMLACTHASTVEDGKEAFLQWTTGHGAGTYAGDYDMIVARWDYNFAKRNKAGNAVKVGTFNKHLRDAGHADKVKNSWDSTPEEDFGADQGSDASAPPPAAVRRPRVVLEQSWPKHIKRRPLYRKINGERVRVYRPDEIEPVEPLEDNV